MFEINTATVRTSYANVREEADQRSELYSQLLFGQEVLIIEGEGKWFKCKLPDKSSGWIRKGYLHVNQEYSFFHEAKTILVVSAFITSAFREPDSNSPTVIKLLNGSPILPTGKKENGYLEILLPGEKRCWLSELDCRDNLIEPEVELADQIINQAKQFLGTPYLWGGTSPYGIDCSGLVQHTFRHHGINLPRNASQQAKCGEEIDTSTDLEEVEKGDLLFFSEGKGVDHVAISLGGDQVIHSSFSNGCVAIESLDYDAENFSSLLRACYHSARKVID